MLPEVAAHSHSLCKGLSTEHEVVVLRVQVGDKILMINGHSTDGMGHADAVQLLKSASPVTLQVMQGMYTPVIPARPCKVRQGVYTCHTSL